MSEVVLDASTILAYLFEESGYQRVEAVLASGNGVISSVNYAEVVGKLVDKKMPSGVIQIAMDNLELKCFLVGQLRQISKDIGLSLGDRACIALGIDKKLPVLTADTIWKEVSFDCNIQLLR